jgi:hypothetical protein
MKMAKKRYLRKKTGDRLRASEEYFRNGGQGPPFEQVVAGRRFPMEQIRGAKKQH